MVHLDKSSAVDPKQYPHSYRWDTLVRKHFEEYQYLIDAQIYRLQRIQRGLSVTNISIRHCPTPSTTILNYSLFNCSKRSSRWEKLIRVRLTSIKILIPVLLRTITALLRGSSTYLMWDWEWELSFLLIQATLGLRFLRVLFCLWCR